MTEVTQSNWVVLKFGGTSVSTKARWDIIADIARTRIDEGLKPFIVCSALSGISDLLERVVAAAPKNKHQAYLDQILAKHKQLAKDLGLDADEILKVEFDQLARLVLGVSLIGEVSPRLQAQVLALGELMSTRLGAAYLNTLGLDTQWQDSRKMLSVSDCCGGHDEHRFLSATCEVKPDKKLRTRIDDKAAVVIAQGFIASDAAGHTVLLGRGGSDTSAAYFAVKLSALRCEIWTDVRGVYSANPKLIPQAHLLRHLDYTEAQEIMYTGAKILHPRCIQPVKPHGIPIHIRNTEEPDQPGTIISNEAVRMDADLKAISTKRGITLVSMETINMWQEVGFLADVFACFKQHGLSIDSVSTSETNVTASLDAQTNVLNREILKELKTDLQRFCKVTLIEGCAQISLVGRNIRSILHKLGSTFELFEEKKIYMLSQASNDLNLSFVVDEDEAERLVRELHAMLFNRPKDARIDQASDDDLSPLVPDEARTPEQIWWKRKREALLEIAADATPLYVYDEATLRQMIGALAGLKNIDRSLYAIKANWHADIIRIAHEMGMGFETVSPGEIQHLFELLPDLKNDPKRILFTPNFAPREEYRFALDAGVNVTLDNLFPLEHWPETFKGRELFVRLDPGKGKGHHEYVQTAGVKSKFGIIPPQLERLRELAAACDARIVGLHAHTGSGILSSETWQQRAGFLAQAMANFPDIHTLDLGGGLGIPEKPGQPTLDMAALDASMEKVRKAFPNLQLWLEPGRYVSAQAGVLLGRVTQTKPKGEQVYVGIDTGMNTLIRPMLYGSFHEIVNLSRIHEEPTMIANIVGPICESGDTLGYARRIAPASEGDIILIATAGAYGRAMSSTYNMRPPAKERLLKA